MLASTVLNFSTELFVSMVTRVAKQPMRGIHWENGIVNHRDFKN